MTKVLIVEDEKALAEGLRFNLEQERYEVHLVDNAEDALARLESDTPPFDLVLFDVMLPGMDGFHAVTLLRDQGNHTPVLMLTARSRPEDVLRGFEAGADDYVPKPFDLAILLARVRSLLRRSQTIRSADPAPAAPSYQFSGRVVDFTNLFLIHGDKQTPLTVMEANLLRYLADRANQTVPRRELLESVWGVRDDTDTRAVDNFIVRLRRYIEDEPSDPRFLVTVRGVGYRFVPQPDAPKS